ncbi:Ionotropic receptor [Blattella germanica]|nr:Ionotropic receptor [Blattella germanica]
MNSKQYFQMFCSFIVFYISKFRDMNQVVFFGTILFIVGRLRATSAKMNSAESRMVMSYLNERRWSAAVLFICEDTAENLKWMKQLSSFDIQATIYSPMADNIVPTSLTTRYHLVAAVVDLSCDGVVALLTKASEWKMFSSLHYWLLVSENLNSEDVSTLLNPLNIALNSHVTLAQLGKEPFSLQDMYRIRTTEDLTFTSSLKWNPGQVLRSRPPRDDYRGVSLTATVLIYNDTWENFLDIAQRDQNTEAKFHYVLMAHVAEMLNFRMNRSITDIWGYPLNGSKCFNGIIGTIQEDCGESDISATGLMWKTERLEVVDYFTDTFKYKGAFIFLKPSLSEVSIIYELPFSISVWVTFSVTMAALTIFLVYVQRTENHIHSKRKNEVDESLNWSDAVLDTIGIVCQQGTGNTPKYLAARMIFIFLLLLSLFLVTSYSAIIVSLLQTTSSAINTLSDLMNSPFKLSLCEMLINEVTDPTVEKVFKEKLYTQPYHEAFMSEEEGMEKIRKGLYAFHALFAAHKIISDTFEEHEKCRVKQIPMFLANHIGFPIRKGSPYAEHMRRSIQWMRETGILGREINRWYYQEPKCISGGQNFVSVGIQEFYPTLVILSYGILLSIGVFVLEAVHHRYRHAL